MVWLVAGVGVVLAFAVAGSSARAATVPVWPAASELTPPADATTTSHPYATIYGVSCTSAGDCVAGGRYVDSSGADQAMVATETGGSWGQAIKLELPADANTSSQNGSIGGVSCTSAGDCVAGGYYRDSSGAGQAMVATEASASWGPAGELALPVGARSTGQNASVSGVSCTSAGDRVAGGRYVDSSGADQAMVATETGGSWGQAIKLELPADANTSSPFGYIGGVSCTSAGNCVAGGDYLASSGAYQAMVATETDGTWGQASELAPPAGTNSSPNGYIGGVSCTSAGNCVAGGLYRDSSGALQAMVATETGGSWGRASELALPAGADTTSSQNAFIGGVSCTSTGDCLGGGYYVDSSGAYQAMVATETGGSWGQATELAPPAGANSSPNAYIGGVSCTSAGDCLAGGGYRDLSGNGHAMVLSSVGSLSVASASLPSGIVGSAYHAGLSASGGSGSYTWSLVSGSLPTGLSLSPDGTISGRPTMAGTRSFTVRLSDPGPPVQQATTTMSITIAPAPTRSIHARVGNQRITLTVSSACVAPSSRLSVKFASTGLPNGTKLRFAGVVFYLGRGIKHRLHERVRGKRRLITVYLPNATKHHQPVSVSLSLARLRAGAHTLKVVASYKKTIRKHGHKQTITVTKTLRVTFVVC